MLTLLAFGDLFTCMGIFALGIMRNNSTAMESGKVPIEVMFFLNELMTN